jgi:hypothetical protein
VLDASGKRKRRLAFHSGTSGTIGGDGDQAIDASHHGIGEDPGGDDIHHPLASTPRYRTPSTTMNCPPPSPPMKGSGGHPPSRVIRPPRSTVDNQQKQQLLEKLKRTATSSSKRMFKVPVLPPRPTDPIKAPTEDHASTREERRPGNVDKLSASSSRPTSTVVATSVTQPNPITVKTSVVPQQKKKAQRTAVPRQKPVNPVVQQVSEAEMMFKEFGYTTPEEIELHKRINKHVNGYLRKACGIPGGTKAYTEAEAATVSSPSFSSSDICRDR